MTVRGALLGTAAAVAAAAGWTVSASMATLALTGLWDHPYYANNPAWTWAWASYMARPEMREAIGPTLSTSALAATVLVGAVAMKAGWQRLHSRPALHGESHWATKEEVQKRPEERSGLVFSPQPAPDGVVLGLRKTLLRQEYVSLVGEEHVALTARTRSGKGVSFVVPNALHWSGSLVCFSVKRDVWEAAAAHRARSGDEVFIFDLSDPHRRTHRWNPLGYVRRGDPATYSDIQRAMWFLVPETKANNPFWDNAARKIATAIGVILAETPGAALTVAAILAAVRRPDYDVFLSGLIDRARREGRPYQASAVGTIQSWLERKGDNGPEDVRETLTTALALWNDPVVAAATEVADFDIGELRSRRMAVFVCGGPADVRLYRPIYGLLFQQMVQLNTREEFGRAPNHRHRVLGLLDEFWALGKQDVLADAAAFTASYGFRWAYVQQTKAQSVTAFGEHGADNLFNNTGAEIVFGGTDLKTAREVSERMGFNTVEDVTKSRPRFMGWLHPAKQTESEAARRRALMLPQEIQNNLPKTKAIVLRPGHMPLRLQRIEWWRDGIFSRMGGEPPPVPTLRITVERDTAPPAPTEEEEAQREAQHAEERLGQLLMLAQGAAQAAERAAEEEKRAGEEARRAAAQAAALGEQARHVRAEATEATKAARAARRGLEEAVELGVVPPGIQAAAEGEERRAASAQRAAEAVSAQAAEAVEVARAAKAAATTSARAARAAAVRADQAAQRADQAAQAAALAG